MFKHCYLRESFMVNMLFFHVLERGEAVYRCVGGPSLVFVGCLEFSGGFRLDMRGYAWLISPLLCIMFASSK